ncbi:methylated-DNA--[protein]-cysteine S-methyltransferase [Aerococcaceae bacterium DSM 111022]|nr:methylated-DNA--[protein]-cysteine S-methyltransferase [Aerococcaceae bacterium DSM 111022]
MCCDKIKSRGDRLDLKILEAKIAERNWIIVGNSEGIAYVGLRTNFEKYFERLFPQVNLEEDNESLLMPYYFQLVEYFEGEREIFDFEPLECGTVFQQAVWQALREVPFGSLVTYSDIAKSIGRPKAVRAVGGAIGRNPLLVFTPCHRVVGKDGALTGFSSGIDLKKLLLQIEKRNEYA